MLKVYYDNRRFWLCAIAFLLSFVCCRSQHSVPFLPEQVAYCGPMEDYFLGSGVAGAMGTPNGEWNALIGPNYTSPNFLSGEVLSINIDGKNSKINPSMHRGRRSGIFYGSLEIEGMSITLTDFTNDKKPWVVRYLSVKNNSSAPRKVSMLASIKPADVASQIVEGSALLLHADTSKWNFDKVNLESKNWADRYSLIAFNVQGKATKVSDQYQVQTEQITVNAGKEYKVALYHYQYYTAHNKKPEDYIKFIRARDSEAGLKKSIEDWKDWFAEGTMYETQVKEQKAKDVIEGSLVIIKMLQDSSGGFIAGLREYPHSYVRDTHAACRLLSITGHHAEVKKAIETICYKTKVFKHIPNAWQMGADFFHYYKFNNPASETPAYFVLMTKFYLENSGDKNFIESIYPFIKNAVDVQMAEMKRNNWRIDFNGDETERYTVRKDGDMYGMLAEWSKEEDLKNWSFPSAVLALASTNFLSAYLRNTGRKELAAEYLAGATRIKNSIDTTFWRSDLKIHDWCRKRDSTWPAYRLPNYNLLPVWIGARLNNETQGQNALYMKQFINPKTGYLPTAPGDVEGFSGHNLAYMLYALKKLDDPKADDVYRTLITAPIIYCWGTVSEFYGPNATPNGHLLNPFSSGILAEALIRYAIGFNEKKIGFNEKKMFTTR